MGSRVIQRVKLEREIEVKKTAVGSRSLKEFAAAAATDIIRRVDGKKQADDDGCFCG